MLHDWWVLGEQDLYTGMYNVFAAQKQLLLHNRWEGVSFLAFSLLTRQGKTQMYRLKCTVEVTLINCCPFTDWITVRYPAVMIELVRSHLTS